METTKRRRVETHKDLDAWIGAMALTVRIYRITAGFPREELYGLTSQMRRAGVSIAANIAEGFGRGQTTQFVQFLRIAQGSVQELDTHVLLSEQLGYLDEITSRQLQADCASVGRLTRGLLRSLQDRIEREASQRNRPPSAIIDTEHQRPR